MYQYTIIFEKALELGLVRSIKQGWLNRASDTYTIGYLNDRNFGPWRLVICGQYEWQWIKLV